MLFAGEIGRRKGVDILLRAWPRVVERHPDAELVLAGPCGDVPVPRMRGVRFLGSVSSDEVRDLLRRVDVAVLPSRAEAMPMFVLEAMAAARCVVTTDVGHCLEVLGDAGVVVPKGCAESLEQVLKALLDDLDLVAHYGAAARRRVVEHHDISELRKDMLLFLRSQS